MKENDLQKIIIKSIFNAVCFKLLIIIILARTVNNITTNALSHKTDAVKRHSTNQMRLDLDDISARFRYMLLGVAMVTLGTVTVSIYSASRIPIHCPWSCSRASLFNNINKALLAVGSEEICSFPQIKPEPSTILGIKSRLMVFFLFFLF